MNPPSPPIVASKPTPPPPPIVTPVPMPPPTPAAGAGESSASSLSHATTSPTTSPDPHAINWPENLATALFSSSVRTKGSERSGDDRLPLPTNTVINKYTIISMLGRGGYGITYKARHTEKGKIVVIKEHMPLGMAVREPGSLDVSFPNPKAEARFHATMDEFLKEITVLQSLEHPGIVPIIDFFEENDTAYYVMPFIPGTTLGVPEKATLNMSLRRQEAAHLKQFLLSLLKTLDYLGQHNIVHSDIKPENILINKNGVPVLLDFGSSRQLQPGRVFTNVFTPDFCAPEQDCARSDEQMSRSLGPHTDIYSLGATFYYLVSHLMPPRAEIRVLSSPDPYKPLAKRPELQELYGADFLLGIDRAMELEPADRWRSAAEWIESIDQDSSTPSSPRLKRRLKIAGALALAAVVVVGGLGICALKERQRVREAYNSGLIFTEGILYDFSTELIDLPGSVPLQRRLSSGLQKYLSALQDMPQGHDNRLDRAMAAAWFNIGCTYMSLGQLSDAKRALEQGETLERMIKEKHPDDQRFRYELSRSHLKLAELAVRTANPDEADRHARAASDLLGELYRKYPNSPDYGSGLGEALLFNVQQRTRLGDYGGRREILDRALALHHELVRLFPRHLPSVAGLGMTRYYYSLYAEDMGDFEAAENHLDKAYKIYTDLTDNYPYRLSYRRGMALILYRFGDLYFYEALEESDPERRDRKNKKSTDTFDKYISAVRELRNLDDDNLEYLYLESQALVIKTDLLLQRGKANEAANLCRTLVESTERLLANEPGNKDYIIARANALCLQAIAHLRVGRHRAKAAEELAEAREILRAQVHATKTCPDDLRFAYAETLLTSAEAALGDNEIPRSIESLKKADEQILILTEKNKHIPPRLKRCIDHVDKLRASLKLSQSQKRHVL